MESDKLSIELKETKEAPNLQILKDTFGISEKDAIISYGDTIYAPNKTMSRDLLVHELVHCERQGFNKDKAKQWWNKYINDKDFRLREEAEAFYQQYEYCKKIYTDKNRQNKILHALAYELSSSRYGYMISQMNAVFYIKDLHNKINNI